MCDPRSVLAELPGQQISFRRTEQAPGNTSSHRDTHTHAFTRKHTLFNAGPDNHTCFVIKTFLCHYLPILFMV